MKEKNELVSDQKYLNYLISCRNHFYSVGNFKMVEKVKKDIKNLMKEKI